MDGFFFFLPWSHIHYIFITTIFIIIRLCHLPSLSPILLRAKSAVSHKKVIHCLHWWAVIQLSSFQCCGGGCRTWQTGSWHPTSALSTIQFERKHYQNGILSNYLITLYIQLQCLGAASATAFPFVREVKYQLCTWSQMIQLSCACCLHVYLFVVLSKP